MVLDEKAQEVFEKYLVITEDSMELKEGAPDWAKKYLEYIKEAQKVLYP